MYNKNNSVIHINITHSSNTYQHSCDCHLQVLQQRKGLCVLFPAELKPWVELQQSLGYLENHSLNNTHMWRKTENHVSYSTHKVLKR